MIYLSAGDLLHVARRATGAEVDVRDHGLLQSAAARPRTTVAGQDAYPDLATRAGALLHSLARNHPLLDGNERLVLADPPAARCTFNGRPPGRTETVWCASARITA